MVVPKQISEIARAVGIRQDEIEAYGSYKAKVSLNILERLTLRPNGKLINVTSLTPTKFGEGKTSTAIGLTEALGKLKKKVMLCLREPSLGPIFGIKGSGCGKGKAQIIPTDDINLHFTRDIYAVCAAHNLLAAMIDNHIYRGNRLNIDINKIVWRRVIDINDRSLRYITVALPASNRSRHLPKSIAGRVGKVGKQHGLTYESGFDITASSEIMAILALTTDIKDLKERLSRVIVAYTKKEKPITAKDLKVVGAMAALLKDAIKPNLVQTIEGQAVFVHTGPFANIAHGNNSFLSLVIALKLADYVVTENGFGTDLGTEKFFDIVCRLHLPQSKETLKPSLSVLVVSTRAIKAHGGMGNLKHHIENIKKFGVKPVVAINKFPEDSNKELEAIKKFCNSLATVAVISEVVTKGGAGGIELAESCIKAMHEHPSNFKHLYNLNEPVKDKIYKIATQIYGASGVTYTKQAEDDIAKLTSLGYDKLAVNIAKTHLSLSDDPAKKGTPVGWKLKINSVRISAGAGFIIPIAGNIELMPGLPKRPAAERIDIDQQGNVIGLG